MNYEDKIHDRQIRYKTVSKWKNRFKRYKKKTGNSTAHFCRTYNVEQTHLSHLMSGRRGATWDTINKVEEGLKIEGIS